MPQHPEFVLTNSTVNEFNNIGYDIKPILDHIRTDDPARYIVRIQGGFDPIVYGYKDEQLLFGEFQSYTSQLGAALLALAPPGDKFGSLLSLCRLRRNEIAEINCQPDYVYVGIFRTDRRATHCRTVYKDLERRFYAMIRDADQRSKIAPFVTEESKGYIINHIKLNNCSYEGNGYLYIPDGTNQLKIIHPKNSLPYTYCENLIEKGMNAASLADIHRVAAEMFWLICAFKPFRYGDPSIAESIIKALYLYKGYQMPAWKENIIPWVEATLCFDVAAFSELFTKLLDGDFTQVESIDYKAICPRLTHQENPKM